MRAIMAFVALGFLVLSASGASAAVPMTVTVSMAPSAITVHSNPTATTNVTFNGTVKLDKLPAVRVMVSLTSSVSSGGWPSSVKPSSMVITDKQPHAFKCTVVIPAGTHPTVATITVTVYANAILITKTAKTSSIITVI